MTNRVVITGMGAVTPLGNTVDEFWDGLKAGKNGIAPITKFDATETGITVAGELKDFDATNYMQRKISKRMDEFSRYGVAAAVQAVEESGIDREKTDMNRFGVIVGSGIGGLNAMQEQIIKMNTKGPQRVAPFFVPMAIGNMAAGNISIAIGTKGINTSIVTACASGNNSIGEAYRNIKHGYSDVILAGGAEGTINEIGISGFAALTALSTSTDPDRASIPFDKERTGFVMGEGAAVLMLESLDHALERGATIYAEIVGYGSTGDGYHMTAPTPDGSGAGRAMQDAMAEAGITPADVGYINAHGTSTGANDSAETMAIKYAFGDEAKNVAISSTKSMTGHLLGAAGAIEAVACVKALQDGFLPPTIGLQVPDEACDLDYIPNVGRKADIKYTLNNSLGFGGHNAVTCFKKWEGQ
ncbi:MULTISPECIES: beta-ketoacyl-ACP synthase II [Carnobacterium]|jgi:3-oxoacyl-[acyl-carrier-protein] synthase II|uniref:3-oxoacyl-[acyl-carrier-protein] synthase 2 n=2 Tax=Carnobacterium inhibens TaxID=147709 RepID=U5SD72_9LACT|nr:MULTISPECIES: beta-ketoacyl-ACP synthase II [Carnobacterium]AGY81797.1 3-oxoacyl-ACP synthase [Carnobacterium inhibens subsp. gilichinskyi]MBC9824956.1 beta-ketoacyl-ACP synthase II [Carnobacterium inhibens]MCM3512414.1 beta-ketoacyl-ACP synthase II [Carnobacterium inhibens]MDN5372512.1 3-oxoacyl-[acyl-carrier-protein] synthase [Carnobacterium sp.]